jgi:hypothetical protein
MKPFPISAFLATAIACIVLASCAGDKKTSPEQQQQPAKKLSPEFQAWWNVCEKAKVGMSEDEVDAVMSGYPSHRQPHWNPDQSEALLTYHSGKEPPSDVDLQRCYLKTYDSKSNANEYDYFMNVLFDQRHLALCMDVSEYIK